MICIESVKLHVLIVMATGFASILLFKFLFFILDIVNAKDIINFPIIIPKPQIISSLPPNIFKNKIKRKKIRKKRK